MRSARPVTAPPGIPPARIFPSAVRSGVTAATACTPPGDQRKPETTSSKISTVPVAAVSARNSASSPAGSGTVPQAAPEGSRMTAATSSSWSAAASAGASAGTTVTTWPSTPGTPAVSGPRNGGSVPKDTWSCQPWK